MRAAGRIGQLRVLPPLPQLAVDGGEFGQGLGVHGAGQPAGVLLGADVQHPLGGGPLFAGDLPFGLRGGQLVAALVDLAQLGTHVFAVAGGGVGLVVADQGGQQGR